LLGRAKKLRSHQTEAEQRLWLHLRAQKIVATLATQLVASYGRSFEARNLRRMMQFAEQFPDFGIVSPLATQLSWTHIVEVLPLKGFVAEPKEKRP